MAVELTKNKYYDRVMDFLRSEKAWLIFIFVLSLALRLIYMYQNQSNPVYVDRGSRLPVFEKWSVTHPFWRPVVFSYFTYALYNFLFRNFTLLQIAFYVIGSINCILIYFAAKKVFNTIIARTASFIASVYGVFLFY